MKLRILVCLCTAFLVAACATRNKPFASLENQGPLALSYDNAYLGSNLFLGKEIEDSTYLYNFFASRGGPTAIELVKKSRWRDPQVLLYYPKNYEFYIASLTREQSGDRERKEWIVRGPFAIARKLSHDLQRMEDARQGEPLFEVWGRTQRFKTDIAGTSERKVIVPVFAPTPTPRPTPRRPRTSTKVITSAPPKPMNPTNLDQRALAESKNLAPRNAAGDLVHSVTSAAQSFSSIAAWYTGSSENAKAIAEKSGLPDGTTLTVGTTITIPASLVKNPMILR